MADRPLDYRYKRRGHEWRVQSDDKGRFDELAVQVGRSYVPPKLIDGKRNPKADARSGLILHAEMMDNRSCFVDVAGLCLWVHVGRDGVARISSAEDRRRGRRGFRCELLRDPWYDEENSE
jgi:hypothetical protein